MKLSLNLFEFNVNVEILVLNHIYCFVEGELMLIEFYFCLKQENIFFTIVNFCKKLLMAAILIFYSNV